MQHSEHAIIATVAGKQRACELRRNDSPWGHAVSVILKSAVGIPEQRFKFLCHPGFTAFPEWQAKSTEELFASVRERLESGALDASLELVADSGLEVLVVFNGPDRMAE